MIKSIPSSQFRNPNGFSLVEVMVSMAILVVSISLTFGGFMYMQKNEAEQYAQTELDIDLRLATQRLQHEMRLSALDQMVFYPSGAKKYTAVSFPLNGANSLSKTNGVILWDSTVIYHVSKQEDRADKSRLIRTVFSNRNASLSTGERQLQLEQVVYDGHGENAAAEGESVSSSCLFEQVFNWEIIPQGSLYDGYAPNYTVDEHARLGYFNLDGGEHVIRFEVVGKSSDSDGYRIGLDTISFSRSQSIREAEDLVAYAVPSPRVEVDQGDISNYRKLEFDATEIGQALEVRIYNDRWEDTTFASVDADMTDTLTRGYDSDYEIPEITLRLRGNTTNEFAVNQTGDVFGNGDSGAIFNGAVVRTIIKGAEILSGSSGGISHEGEGVALAFFSNYTAQHPNTLEIESAYIDECSSDAVPVPDTLGHPMQITFDGGQSRCSVITSDPVWSDLMDYPISPNKNYAVTFSITPGHMQGIHPRIWEGGTNAVNSYYLTQDAAESSFLTSPDWSGNTNVISSPDVIGVGEVFVSFPSNGVFTSSPFDTHMQQPQYELIDWDADTPNGTSLAIEVRTASKADMSDATGWRYIATPGSVGLNYLQYVQYRATLSSSGKGFETPKLKKMAVQWKGDTSAVCLSGRFINGPDYGQFKALVDGQELASPLRINLMIRKDVRSFGGTFKTMQSNTSFELTPRNSF